MLGAYLAIPKGYAESTRGAKRASQANEVNVQGDPQSVVSELESLAGSWDLEKAHHRADRCLCELLAVLGFEEIAQAHGKIEKGYGVIRSD